MNTFQCVIATDGNTTFAIFLYNKIEWTTAIGTTPAKVGFNDGMHQQYIVWKLYESNCIHVITKHKVASNSFIMDVGIREASWEMPCSGTENISMLTSSSNVGEPGVWIFRVDGTDIIPACPNEGLLHNYG